jgi:hypothetical protein
VPECGNWSDPIRGTTQSPRKVVTLIEDDNPSQSPVLTGWKEIATYLSMGVRTVQRHERGRGLPIHRPGGNLKGPVLAVKVELDQWVGLFPKRLIFECGSTCDPQLWLPAAIRCARSAKPHEKSNAEDCPSVFWLANHGHPKNVLSPFAHRRRGLVLSEVAKAYHDPISPQK